MIEKVFSVDIAAPVERVWQEVTRTGTRCRPMFGTALHVMLEPGSPIRYRSLDGKHTFVAGEVVDVDPPRRFVHTFLFPNIPGAPTVVAWELSPIGGGTRLTVTHSRFDGETKTYKAVTTGWPKILGLFKEVIETGDVSRGVKFKQWLMGAMSFLLPKSLRTPVVEADLSTRSLRP